MASTAPQAPEIQRRELHAAITKAAELRALHAALLLHGNGASPATSQRLPPAASPAFAARPSGQLSAEDYPVFTPSYEGFRGHPYCRSESRALSYAWGDHAIEEGSKEDEFDHYIQRIDHKSPSMNRERQMSIADDQKSTTSSCRHTGLLQKSPGGDFLKSWRIASEELNPASSCNECKPASLRRDSNGDSKCHKHTLIALPVSNASSGHLPPKSNKAIFSWRFPRLRKKNKPETSPNAADTQDLTQLFKEWGVCSIESLKRELAEANENRDAALAEVGEMRCSLEELKQQLGHLESYCEELKLALKQAVQGKEMVPNERRNGTRRTKSVDGVKDSSITTMPVSHEVMVEGFIQIVSEARLSVKHFCKTLLGQIEETDGSLLDKINQLLLPQLMTINTKSRGAFYYLEALINNSLYQDFENCVFQKNGSPKLLDPQQDRQANFSSFVALRNLSWNEVLRKGTKYYSEDFSRFCDQKMSGIVSLLDWSRPWPEELLQTFFVASKCIWLLHLLAFSFDPPLMILRVGENKIFDASYMEDVMLERHRAQAAQPASKVKIMVMPGFYVQDKVLKCKVLCKHRSVQ